MRNWFNISDFCIEPNPISQEIADKILKYHLLPMNKVREVMGIPVWPSKKSGYRSPKWEKSKGRNGNSQHTFRAEGAVDITCLDFENKKNDLLRALIENTSYDRICLYETFAHCDYAGLESKFFMYENGNWTYKCPLEWEQVKQWL